MIAYAFLLKDSYSDAHRAAVEDYTGIVTTVSGMRIALGHHNAQVAHLPDGEYDFSVTCLIDNSVYIGVTEHEERDSHSALWVWVGRNMPSTGTFKQMDVGTFTFEY